MSKSLTNILIHIVFSTKDRQKLLQHLRILCEYIANQEEHHKHIDFRDEFLSLLKKYSIDYDKQYLWS